MGNVPPSSPSDPRRRSSSVYDSDGNAVMGGATPPPARRNRNCKGDDDVDGSYVRPPPDWKAAAKDGNGDDEENAFHLISPASDLSNPSDVKKRRAAAAAGANSAYNISASHHRLQQTPVLERRRSSKVMSKGDVQQSLRQNRPRSRSLPPPSKFYFARDEVELNDGEGGGDENENRNRENRHLGGGTAGILRSKAAWAKQAMAGCFQHPQQQDRHHHNHLHHPQKKKAPLARPSAENAAAVEGGRPLPRPSKGSTSRNSGSTATNNDKSSKNGKGKTKKRTTKSSKSSSSWRPERAANYAQFDPNIPTHVECVVQSKVAAAAPPAAPPKTLEQYDAHAGRPSRPSTSAGVGVNPPCESPVAMLFAEDDDEEQEEQQEGGRPSTSSSDDRRSSGISDAEESAATVATRQQQQQKRQQDWLEAVMEIRRRSGNSHSSHSNNNGNGGRVPSFETTGTGPASTAASAEGIDDDGAGGKNPDRRSGSSSVVGTKRASVTEKKSFETAASTAPPLRIVEEASDENKLQPVNKKQGKESLSSTSSGSTFAEQKSAVLRESIQSNFQSQIDAQLLETRRFSNKTTTTSSSSSNNDQAANTTTTTARRRTTASTSSSSSNQIAQGEGTAAAATARRGRSVEPRPRPEHPQKEQKQQQQQSRRSSQSGNGGGQSNTDQQQRRGRSVEPRPLPQNKHPQSPQQGNQRVERLRNRYQQELKRISRQSEGSRNPPSDATMNGQESIVQRNKLLFERAQRSASLPPTPSGKLNHGPRKGATTTAKTTRTSNRRSVSAPPRRVPESSVPLLLQLAGWEAPPVKQPPPGSDLPILLQLAGWNKAKTGTGDQQPRNRLSVQSSKPRLQGNAKIKKYRLRTSFRKSEPFRPVAVAANNSSNVPSRSVQVHRSSVGQRQSQQGQQRGFPTAERANHLSNKNNNAKPATVKGRNSAPPQVINVAASDKAAAEEPARGRHSAPPLDARAKKKEICAAGKNNHQHVGTGLRPAIRNSGAAAAALSSKNAGTELSSATAKQGKKSSKRKSVSTATILQQTMILHQRIQVQDLDYKILANPAHSNKARPSSSDSPAFSIGSLASGNSELTRPMVSDQATYNAAFLFADADEADRKLDESRRQPSTFTISTFESESRVSGKLNRRSGANGIQACTTATLTTTSLDEPSNKEQPSKDGARRVRFSDSSDFSPVDPKSPFREMPVGGGGEGSAQLPTSFAIPEIEPKVSDLTDVRDSLSTTSTCGRRSVGDFSTSSKQAVETISEENPFDEDVEFDADDEKTAANSTVASNGNDTASPEKPPAGTAMMTADMKWSYKQGGLGCGVTPFRSGSDPSNATDSPRMRFNEARTKFARASTAAAAAPSASPLAAVPTAKPSPVKRSSPVKHTTGRGLVLSRIAEMEARRKSPLQSKTRRATTGHRVLAPRKATLVSTIFKPQGEEEEELRFDTSHAADPVLEEPTKKEVQAQFPAKTSAASSDTVYSASEGTQGAYSQVTRVSTDEEDTGSDEQQEEDEYFCPEIKISATFDEDSIVHRTATASSTAAEEEEEEEDSDDEEEDDAFAAILQGRDEEEDDDEEDEDDETISTVKQDKSFLPPHYASYRVSYSEGTRSDSSVTSGGTFSTIEQQRLSFQSSSEGTSLSTLVGKDSGALPFRDEAPVKPNEQRGRPVVPGGSALCLSPTLRTPMQAMKWRSLAMAAQQKDNNKSNVKPNKSASLSERHPNVPPSSGC